MCVVCTPVFSQFTTVPLLITVALNMTQTVEEVEPDLSHIHWSVCPVLHDLERS